MPWHIKRNYGFDQDHPSTNLFCLQPLIHFQWNKNACRDDSDMFFFKLSDLRPPSILHCFIRYFKFWKIPFSIFIFHLCKHITTRRIESFLMFRIHLLSVISFNVVCLWGWRRAVAQVESRQNVILWQNDDKQLTFDIVHQSREWLKEIIMYILFNILLSEIITLFYHAFLTMHDEDWWPPPAQTHSTFFSTIAVENSLFFFFADLKCCFIQSVERETSKSSC